MTSGQFRRYDHVERLGHPEVRDLTIGKVYVFPKLDGTNGSVWLDDAGNVQCGSRNRVLSLDADNHGFCAWVHGDSDEAVSLRCYVRNNPHLVVYGEWLVPHTLKTYRETVWKRFWIFDVYDREKSRYLSWEEYGELQGDERSAVLHACDFVEPICTIENPSEDQLQVQVETNTYLIADGAGLGEGVVVKNYAWQNLHGRQPWAKIVREEYKQKKKKTGPKPKPVEQRFWSKVNKTETCWLWTAATNGRGYGSITVRSKVMKAHRVSWMLEHGDPGDLDVCHSCDNPSCVRPEHLFLGTHVDNMRDMAEKERSGVSKLTVQDVKQIRRQFDQDQEATMKDLGDAYGVTPENISHIVNFRTWKHVEEDCSQVEAEIAEAYCTPTLVGKTRAKVVADVANAEGIDLVEDPNAQSDVEHQFRHRVIPQLLGRVFHDLVVEEAWTIVKKWKNPVVNFKLLQAHVTAKTKEYAKDLF